MMRSWEFSFCSPWEADRQNAAYEIPTQFLEINKLREMFTGKLIRGTIAQCVVGNAVLHPPGGEDSHPPE